MLDKTYDPKEIEARRYPEWESAGAFRAHPESAKQPYCIVIPPPNVTGSLHMGHALDNTLQDVLIRWRRMKGDDVLWQPGTDHAGIATQMVVVRNLEQEGIGLAVEGAAKNDANKKLLNREEFLAKVWEWKAYSGGTITGQLRRLGASCDWSRERFTMDEGLSKAVLKVFVELYKAGPDLQGPAAGQLGPQDADRDLRPRGRVARGEGPSLVLQVSDRGQPDEFIVVATTRPETMLGDTGIAVHPDDPKWKHLIGKHAVLPLVGRRIAIVGDEYSDPEKGSGAVKITPAHDFNDFEVGRRHKLEAINIFDKFARVNDKAPEKYRGLDRFDARKKIVAEMEELGLVEKIEPHTHAVPYGDRGGVPVEPYPHRAMVRRRQEARRGADRGGARRPREVRARARPRRFLPLDGEHRAVVRLAPALVGPPDPGLVRARTRRCSWRCPRRRPRPRRARITARTSRWSAIPTCSTPGSARPCGRSRPWAGPTRRRNSRSTIRPARWSPAGTSCSSGSPA